MDDSRRRAATGAPAVSKWRAWWLAARPRTLPAAVGPIVLGQALVVPEAFSWTVAALCLVCALALQLASNLANDLFDGLAGIDGRHRLGPPRALASGLLSAWELRAVLAGVLGLAALAGVVLAIGGHWLLWPLGALAMVAVLGYSGGPRPYASAGLGEAAVWLFFGPVGVLGSLLAQQSPISTQAVAAAALAGLPAAAIMLVNNLRDRRSDARAGKRTLAVTLGRGWSVALYAALVLAPAVLSMPPGRPLGFWVAWMVLVAAAGVLVLRVSRRDGAALNPLIGHTALYALACCLWLAAAFTGA